MSETRPLLAITMGDPAGTGPEIVAKALLESKVRAGCRPLVIGDAGTMREAVAITKVPLEVRSVAEVSEAGFDPGRIEVLDLRNVDLAKLERGRVSRMAGQAGYEYVERATALAMDGSVDAIVTSSINKEALNLAGHHYDGHTGLLSALTKTPKVTMMLVAGQLRIAHVSTHVSLREALDRVRPERILEVLHLANEGIRGLGVARPRLAVSGLNPHAGEGGLFGDEEIRYIEPAVAEAVSQGLDVTGPLPGDTVFFRALQGEFDGAIAMYHDQGNVAAKMLGIWNGVNVTLGLPIIRTSVEHGTSFDKAGKGTADTRSMLNALELGALMATTRKQAATSA